MTPVPIKDVIEALSEDVKHDDYRRLKWTLASLKAIWEESNYSEHIYVAFYGH